ncbi:MAG: DUF1517 domain-containing protein [Cyanobacteria bacterium RI_101]|nr:DUF1517 domain-containing protein [Cyanobacteria bacterium RI_101]
MLFPLKALLKPALIVSLIVMLVFGASLPAEAARSGGRIGGGSFRAPSRSYSAPSRGYSSGGGSVGYGGGGVGFPLILPFLGFGGFGSLLSIIVVIAIANILMGALRGAGGGSMGGNALESDNPPVSIVQIQVGLLASARELKKELDDLALSADTGTPEGRAAVLQEAGLALLRHPEYWVYGSCDSDQGLLSAAEAKFNQLSLMERSKFSAETLTNVNNQLRQSQQKSLTGDAAELAAIQNGGGDYILVTLIAAALGNLTTKPVNDSSDLRQALQSLSSVGADRLLAVEVLWTPQAEGDTLTQDDIIAAYPDLKLV